jgi:hypothetical protein
MHALPKPAGATTEASLQILTTNGGDCLVYGRKDLLILRMAIATALGEEQVKPVQQEPVAWFPQQAYAEGRSAYEVAHAKTVYIPFVILAKEEQAFWVAKAAMAFSPQPDHADTLASYALSEARKGTSDFVTKFWFWEKVKWDCPHINRQK